MNCKSLCLKGNTLEEGLPSIGRLGVDIYEDMSYKDLAEELRPITIGGSSKQF